MEEIMLDTRTSMKLACCIALVLGATTLVAQQSSSTSSGRERGDLDRIRKVSTLIGTEVMNTSNSKIAVVRDLALSPDGAVLYVILGYGGVAGVGETYTAAPFDSLGFNQVNGKWAVNLDMTSEDLKKAPAMKSENCRELTDAQWIARVAQFFRPRAGSQVDSRQGDRPAQQERRAVERVLLAKQISGAKFKNNQLEDMGKVENLLLDRRYQAVFAIIGRGGVLGIGQSNIPVPWSKLGFSFDRDARANAVIIEASKDQLDKAPLVKGDNYATLLAPGFAEQVRQHFGKSVNTSD
jgi:hypothetical protein